MTAMGLSSSVNFCFNLFLVLIIIFSLFFLLKSPLGAAACARGHDLLEFDIYDIQSVERALFIL